MDLRPSRITTDSDGWTWLAAGQRGAHLRLAFWSTVLSVLLLVLAAAATLPPPALAVPLVTLVLGAGSWLTVTLWNRSHSAVAVSSLGIVVRSGSDVAAIAWTHVQAVTAVAAGSRLRIEVDARDEVRRTAASFSPDAAQAWLAVCEEHAGRRRVHPRPVDGSPGFRTS